MSTHKSSVPVSLPGALMHPIESLPGYLSVGYERGHQFQCFLNPACVLSSDG